MRAAERAPRARMAFNFVASAVIKSSDGVTFTQETKIEPKDPEKAKKRSMGPAMPIGKSLAEQLAENAEKKDLEWKEANNPFRPPPSMTEDEAMFLEEVKLAEERKRAELEVAAKYSASADSLIFMIETSSFMERGADRAHTEAPTRD